MSENISTEDAAKLYGSPTKNKESSVSDCHGYSYAKIVCTFKKHTYFVCLFVGCSSTVHCTEGMNASSKTLEKASAMFCHCAQ